MRNKYKSSKLEIPDYYGDNEYDIVALHYLLQLVTIHVYDKDEHVGIIKIFTCKFKEISIYTYNLVSYKWTPIFLPNI